MKATEAKLLDFLKKSPQFVIPIYQRTYSWTEKECRQLWDDIVRTGANDRILVNEAETRAEHIDPALKAAGWGVVEGSNIRREYPITPGRIEGHGRRGKPLIADYVLVYRNHKLAVIEAKAWEKR